MRKSAYKSHNFIKRVLAFMLALIMCASVLEGTVCRMEVYAAPQKNLTLKACRLLAIQNSDDYYNAENTIESKEAAYESAIKAIKLKKKKLSTFSWTPLLSFKFPTSPSMAEASEFEYKPVAIQYEIQVAQHNLQDKTYAISEKVNNLYVEIVSLQDTIAFNERRAETYSTGLSKNRARVKLGQATQADVDKIEKKLDATNKKIASDRRNLEADLKKLSDMIGTDVTTGYKFEKPFLEATISRSQLDALIKYTEDRDETYYEACIAEASARSELNTNWGLVRNKYGKDSRMLQPYVTGALNGQKINKRGFKETYKKFLDKIDSYWKGKKRICLFIKVPKLWFKGSMDGARWIDDDPYVLYQNVLDYSSAANEKKAAQKTLDQEVTDTFNNYISVKNSYEGYIKDLDKSEKDLDEAALKNRLGELTFDEYDTQMSDHEELQNSLLSAMKLYTQTLNSFDRLTCGGISAILAGTDSDMGTAVVGTSYVEKKTATGAHYTLRSIIQSLEFELSISIPDDFEVEITDYELWIDNVQVGVRTAKDTKLRHLGLTKDGVDEVKIRLYNGDEFVDDCIIDPSVESGPLTITTGYEVKKAESDELGTYIIQSNDTTGLVELKFDLADKNVAKFKVLTAEGKVLGGDKLTDITKPLVYIPLLQDSLDELKVEFYDSGDGLLYTGRFDSANGKVRKMVE